MSTTAALDRATGTAHTAVRLDFAVDESFEAFRDHFEREVPPLPSDILTAKDSWDAMAERTTAAATHGFLIYNRLDGGPFFARAGHKTPCTTYLMGNHLIAEQMFRFDPAILLYAPLRVAIYGDHEGTTHLVIDQPSTRFGSFENPDIAAVGRMLDDKLAELLPHLGIS